MQNPDTGGHRLNRSLQDAFGTLTENNTVDIVTEHDTDEANTREIQADSWTLVLEGSTPEIAWIAIDEDISNPAQARAALQSTLNQQELGAMITLDDALSGSLSNALRKSGDDLSLALAEMVAAGT